MDIMKQDEVIKALKLIKQICTDNEMCNFCIFGKYDYECMIKDRSKNPEDWNINDDFTWKALV